MASQFSPRRSSASATPYMSERQIQAYLMARDAIRSIQRTSSIFDACEKESLRKRWGTQKRTDRYGGPST